MLQLCIILLVIGVLALALELIMPGYDGFIGAIVGVVALVVSSVLAVMFVPGGWWFVGISVVALILCGYFGWMYVRRGQLHGKVVLSEALGEDLPQVDYASLVGKEGKTVTLLRPSGEADFSGVRVEVTTNGSMVERGTLVRVVEVHANKVIVSVVDGN
jgi:membrane-bound serine protease (ClpP class)